MLHLLILSIFILVSCQPVAKVVNLNSEIVNESGLDSDDAFFENLPENSTARVTEKPNYDFLDQSSFWQEVEEIVKVPRGKHCSNRSSYAHFGIARLVYQKIYSDFKLLPFGNLTRYIPFFDAYPSDPTRNELFLTHGLQAKISELTRYTNNNFNVELTLSSLTKYSGQLHDNHCRHRSGTVIDMRPLPSTEPMEWGDPAYNRSMNLDFIKMLLRRDDVALIFFNDPEILNNDEVNQIIRERAASGDPVLFSRMGGHDNHLHIEFDLDSEVDLVTRYVKQELASRLP